MKVNKQDKAEARDLFMKTVEELGGRFMEDDDSEDEGISFYYQGELFRAYFSSMWVELLRMFWKTIDMYDVDVYHRLREAINKANESCRVTTYYTIDEQQKEVDVHSKSMFIFGSEIKDAKLYLYTQLKFFFDAIHSIELEFERRNRVYYDDD